MGGWEWVESPFVLTVMHNCYSGEDLQTMYLYSLSSFLFILLLFLFSVCLVQNWSSTEQTSDAGGGQTHVKTQGRANNPYLCFRWSWELTQSIISSVHTETHMELICVAAQRGFSVSNVVA